VDAYLLQGLANYLSVAGKELLVEEKMAVIVDLNDQEDKSDGFNSILSLVRDTWDDADPWGSGIAFLYCLADVVYVEDGEILPDYSPSPMLNNRQDLEDEDTFITSELLYMFDEGIVSIHDMVQMYDFLSELDDEFREMGLNY
jgi:hypothetical protein